MVKLNYQEKLIYKIAILLKGINGIFEVILGIVIAFISSTQVYKIISRILHHELTTDPSDFIANYILSFVQGVSFGTKEFIAAYIFIHGVINLGLFYTVWNKKMHFYPIAIIILVLLAVYQVFRLLHKFSILLAVITIIDFAIIFFVVNEYNGKKAQL